MSLPTFLLLLSIMLTRFHCRPAFQPISTSSSSCSRTRLLPSAPYALATATSDSPVLTAGVSTTYTRHYRQDAADIIETTLFPTNLHNYRMDAGRDAQGLGAGSSIEANDPRLAYTYAEFPLRSFDELIDMALGELKNQRGATPEPIKLLDLGSGCGRLVMYAALSRRWNVHGIEIGDELHKVAIDILQKGISEGYFTPMQKSEGYGQVSLHLGAADALISVIEDADIIFAYSTVFPAAQDWNVDLAAMILGPEWSEMLAISCRDGCVAITTDRALDPKYGWKLIDRRDVENPEVLGSTGFVHVLKKR